MLLPQLGGSESNGSSSSSSRALLLISARSPLTVALAAAGGGAALAWPAGRNSAATRHGPTLSNSRALRRREVRLSRLHRTRTNAPPTWRPRRAGARALRETGAPNERPTPADAGEILMALHAHA
ncbi:hypothetical protein FA09DRAFT_331162 [Tilletiopsis washingtonensis]|uniref:Uncharacterized protein n=1 Tax=Tilletiopsis washingtonensis TaxID=58919 RepID=A0A316Z4J4_9BASI|nr:hypothetical protein FA09DRAFT_331162 [Tilletiopsis washingtonensis]PWN96687.1 hypothetical protein FA09DRAFT_331162 [Tilletiopsis washingtonensis]